MKSVPQDQREQARRNLLAFGRQNNIKITMLDNYAENVRLKSAEKLQQTFNDKHVNEPILSSIMRDYLNNFNEHIEKYAASGDFGEFPKNTLKLEGEALQKAYELFVEKLSKKFRQERTRANPEELVSTIFRDVVTPILREKAQAVTEILKTDDLQESQKTALINWVSGIPAAQGGKIQELALISAKFQTNLFASVLSANPPLSPQEILSRLSTVQKDIRTNIDQFNEFLSDSYGKLDEQALAQHTALATRIILENMVPPIKPQELSELYLRLNSPEMRNLLGQLQQIQVNPELSKEKDHVYLNDVITNFTAMTQQLGDYLGQPAPTPLDSFTNLSLLPKGTRDLVQIIAPKTKERLEELYPAYLPFPKPAKPELLPKKHAERRNFLVKHLDTYMAREKNIGEFVHGMGHITRSFIFANAMCGILEEQGHTVDRNAVLCGITGHDIGREGGGYDAWEGKSAQMTIEAMEKDYGQDSLGQDYKESMTNCIVAGQGGNSKTLEAMILKSADSMDIGRTVEFS
ncbi:MAG: hypothetical protein IJT59_03375, partial [Desulfovibrionaceae bacterium]|nr:hypothetical protein [Desulfovibrionaceae bacterium]